MTADLHEVVVAELDRLERLYGGDRKDGRHAALKAAVGWHEPIELDVQIVCGSCACRDDGSDPFPCAQLIDIAKALGIGSAPGEVAWDDE